MRRKITMLTAKFGAGWLLLCFGLAGCSTLSLDMETSGTVPEVEIEGAFFEEIVDGCHEVLPKEGYKFVGQRGSCVIFEKRASTMDYLAWGGWSTSEDELVERLRLNVREVGSDSFQLECQPFFVTDAGGHMEEARKISRLKSGKFQRLLEDVKAYCRKMADVYGSVD